MRPHRISQAILNVINASDEVLADEMRRHPAILAASAAHDRTSVPAAELLAASLTRDRALAE